MNTPHKFIPASMNFDPNCTVCDGKDRDAIHSSHRVDSYSESIAIGRSEGNAVARADEACRMDTVALKYIASLRNGRAVIEASSKAEATRV